LDSSEGKMSTLLCILVFSFSMAFASGQEVGQTATDEAIVDRDYAFRISRPSRAWRLLPEDEVRQIAPDAIAGAVGMGMKVRSCLGAVIVEPIHDMELDQFADLVLEGMAIESKVVQSRERITYCGREAVRLVVRGDVEEVPFHYENHVFINQNHGYQVVGMGPAANVGDGEALREFHQAFELLDGPVSARSAQVAVEDMYGVGWEVVDGAFASAALRLTLAPPPEWRLLVGDELEAAYPDAEVGLMSADSKYYLMIIAESWMSADREAIADTLLQGVVETLEAEPSRAARLEAGGAAREFLVLEPEGDSFTYVYGVWFSNDICYQGMCWFLRGEEDALKRVAEGLRAVRHPGDIELAAIAARLRDHPEPDNQVTSDSCVRGGLFQHFRYGVRLRKPSSGYWRADIGQAAREYGEQVVLLLEEPALGLFCKIEIQPLVEDVPLQDLHRSAVDFESQTLTKADFGEIESGTLAGVECVHSSMWETAEDLDLHYALWTARWRTQVLWITCWGFEGNVKAHRPALDRLLAGLELCPAPISMTESDDEGYRDNRVGFAVVPDVEVQGYSDMTPPEVSPIGTFVFVQDQMAFVIALNAVMFEQDADYLSELVQPFIANHLPMVAAGDPVIEPNARLAGRPAIRQTWGTDRMGCDLYVMTRGRTYYCLLTGGTKVERRRKAGWLRLL